MMPAFAYLAHCLGMAVHVNVSLVQTQETHFLLSSPSAPLVYWGTDKFCAGENVMMGGGNVTKPTLLRLRYRFGLLGLG